MPRHEQGRNFYFVSMVGGKLKWVPLGQDLTAARLKWAELENVIDTKKEVPTFADAARRYQRDVLPEK
jgi:hypothetical protein